MPSALANLLFVPYHPLWSTLFVVLNIWVISSLTRPGAIKK